MSNTSTDDRSNSESNWFGHPRQLARLFTTEMWERFGYYGMRALLTLYLVTHFGFIDDVANGLYGAFTSLVYLTPLIGGLLADGFLGYKRSVKFGAILMSIGYLVLCFGGEKSNPYLLYNGNTYDVSIREVDQESTDADGKSSTKKQSSKFVTLDGIERRIVSLDNGSLMLFSTDADVKRDLTLEKGSYKFDGHRNQTWVMIMFLALSCVIIGNGFFKPNISTIVGSLYEKGDPRRDGGFTIFYMGINLGSMFSQFLCPILAAWLGFWAGFLLAAFGMLCAWALFQFDGGRLKGLGEPPAKSTKMQAALIFVCAIIAIPAVWYLLNNTMLNAEASAKIAKASGKTIEFVEKTSDSSFKARVPAELPLLPVKFGLEGEEYKIVEVKPLEGGYSDVVLDPAKPLATTPIAMLYVVSNADDGSQGAFIFQQKNSDLSINVKLPEKAKASDEDKIPKTPAKFGVDGKVFQVDEIKLLAGRDAEFILNPATPFAIPPLSKIQLVSGPDIIAYLVALPLLGKILFGFSLLAVIGIPIWSFMVGTREEAEKMVVAIVLVMFSVVFWTLFEQAGSSMTLFAERNTDRQVGSLEMPAAQTQIFNPLFIVIFAPLFSIMWVSLGKRGFEPSIPVKFAVGLVLVGLGFLVLVYGSQFANSGFQVGLFWLAMAYLLHSLGELCISPVGLSMITKLSIARVVGLMMGVWFLSSSMAQYVGGIVAQFASVETVGGQVTNLGKSLDTYVSVFQTIGIWSIGFGVLLMVLAPFLKRMMHGVK